MKFSMNGALTIGTLDGANVEIREAVGEANFFLFGLRTEQVAQSREAGYDPMQLYYAEPVLRAALDAVGSGMFSPDDVNRFKPVVDSLLYGGDTYMVLADFLSYVHCERRRRSRVPRPGRLDPQVDPERRAHGPLLQRPHHPRLRARHLGRLRTANRRGPARAWFRRTRCADYQTQFKSGQSRIFVSAVISGMPWARAVAPMIWSAGSFE